MRTLAFCLVLCAALLASGAAKAPRGAEERAERTAAESQPEPAAPAKAQPPKIAHVPFGPMLRLTIKPTLLGLVPPDDPQGFGELLLRLRSVSGQGFSARYIVKELVDRTVPLNLPGSAPAQPSAPPPPPDPRRPKLEMPRSVPSAKSKPSENAPATKVSSQERIRRGEITAAAEASQARIENPLFWGDGDWRVASRLLWLKREDFLTLRDTGRLAWDTLPVQAPDGPVVTELADGLRKKLEAAGAAAGELVVMERDASYPVYLNGERANLPCIRVRDGLNFCNYWILDQPDNPLVLKATFSEEAPGAPGAVPAAPIGLAAPGSGFAVVSIDFSPRLTR